MDKRAAHSAPRRAAGPSLPKPPDDVLCVSRAGLRHRATLRSRPGPRARLLVAVWSL